MVEATLYFCRSEKQSISIDRGLAGGFGLWQCSILLPCSL